MKNKLFKHLRFVNSFPLAMRILNNTIRVRLLEKNRLRNIQICVTYGCNFKCEFCSCNTLIKKEKELSIEQWKKIWDDVYKLGVIHVDITGGEPTLRGVDWLCEFIKYITKNNDIIVSIATNGWNLNEDYLRKLKEAGLNTVELSLHSIDSNVHDKITGIKDSHLKVLEVIHLAKNVGLNVCVSSVLTSKNFDDIENISNFCETLDLIHLIQIVASVGKWTKKEEMEIRDYDEKYEELLSRHSYMRDDRFFNFRGGKLCPGGIEKWYVTAYGDVMQCSFVPVSYGNLLDESAEEIYKMMCECPYLSKRSEKCKRVFDKEFIKLLFEPSKKNKSLPVRMLGWLPIYDGMPVAITGEKDGNKRR